MQDMLDTNNEIQDVLSRSYALPNDVDEDDLDAGTSPLLSPSFPLLSSLSSLFPPLSPLPFSLSLSPSPRFSLPLSLSFSSSINRNRFRFNLICSRKAFSYFHFKELAMLQDELAAEDSIPSFLKAPSAPTENPASSEDDIQFPAVPQSQTV